MLDHALELAACGWQVLPLKGKIPVTTHGCDDATADPEQVRAWWRRWPAANIGARVPSALIVLDVDPRHGGHVGLAQLEVDHEPLPATLTTISGRGDGGRHLYFRRPAGLVTSTRMPKGIDVKTAGYCVVPPSLHPDTGRPYRWDDTDPVPLPPWLREILRPNPPKLRGVRSAVIAGSGRGLVDFVARQPEGERHRALYWAANRALDDNRLDQLEDELVAASVATGEDEVEARRNINTARKART